MILNFGQRNEFFPRIERLKGYISHQIRSRSRVKIEILSAVFYFLLGIYRFILQLSRIIPLRAFSKYHIFASVI